MFTPPRCRVCYDKLNTQADIVLGDPWGMKEIDYNKGNSVIIIRSQTGKKIIEDMRVKNFIVAQKSNIDELLKGQSISLRRLNVSCYSTALKAIPAKLDSYLYNQQDISSLPKNK